MVKKKRLENRKKVLEELANEGSLHCSLHRKYLTAKDIGVHRCYTGYRGKTYCKHLNYPR